MFNTFGRLLCAAVLASTALAQNVSIVLPAGNQLKIGSSIVVELEQSPSSDSVQEVAVVIGFVGCGDGCPTPYLGTVLYSGSYDPKSTNGAGNPSENFTVTIPSYLNGAAEIGVTHLYLSGVYSLPVLQFASISVNVEGGGG